MLPSESAAGNRSSGVERSQHHENVSSGILRGASLGRMPCAHLSGKVKRRLALAQARGTPLAAPAAKLCHTAAHCSTIACAVISASSCGPPWFPRGAQRSLYVRPCFILRLCSQDAKRQDADGDEGDNNRLKEVRKEGGDGEGG